MSDGERIDSADPASAAVHRPRATAALAPAAVVVAAAVAFTVAALVGAAERAGRGGPTLGRYAGTGDTEHPLRLTTGLIVVDIVHAGDGLFEAALAGRGATRATIPLLAVRRPYRGTRVVGAAAGEYAVTVRAEGPWMLTLRRPHPARTPFTFSGAGDGASALLALDGTAAIRGRYQGPGPLAVWLFDERGARVSQLAEAEGEFVGTVRFRMTPGRHVVFVEAGGEWTVEVLDAD